MCKKFIQLDIYDVCSFLHVVIQQKVPPKGEKTEEYKRITVTLIYYW